MEWHIKLKNRNINHHGISKEKRNFYFIVPLNRIYPFSELNIGTKIRLIDFLIVRMFTQNYFCIENVLLDKETVFLLNRSFQCLK